MVARLQHSGSPQKAPMAVLPAGSAAKGAHSRVHSPVKNPGESWGEGAPVSSQPQSNGSSAAMYWPESASSLRSASATSQSQHQQQQQQQEQAYFMVQDEQLDASRYASPQQAFEAVAALCRQQREAFEAAQASWRLEKQEWKETEEDLFAAIKAMHDAVDAEMRAHNLDIQTLMLLREKNATLEEFVRGSSSNAGGVPLQQQQHLPSAAAWSDGHQRSAEKTQKAHGISGSSSLGSAGIHSLLSPEAETRKTNLRNNGGEMPIVSGKMVALQRYDPVTDSYRLSGSGSREHPKGHVDGADRQGATGMSAGGGVLQNSKGATYDESLLRRQNAALAQHVDTLRHSNQEAWEQYRIGTHTHSRSAPVMPSSEDGGVETFFEGEAAA